MSKKVLAPILIAVALVLILIVFTVSRMTSSSPVDDSPEVETLPVTTAAPIETEMASEAANPSAEASALPKERFFENGEELTGEAAEAYAESLANSFKVTESQADDGNTYMIDGAGVIVGQVAGEDGEIPNPTVSPDVEEEDVEQFAQVLVHLSGTFAADKEIFQR